MNHHRSRFAGLMPCFFSWLGLVPCVHRVSKVFAAAAAAVSCCVTAPGMHCPPPDLMLCFANQARPLGEQALLVNVRGVVVRRAKDASQPGAKNVALTYSTCKKSVKELRVISWARGGCLLVQKTQTEGGVRLNPTGLLG